MRGRGLAGVVVALVGVVWIGQGVGLLRGSSFMVGDTRWAAFGVVAVLAGVALLLGTRRRPS